MNLKDANEEIEIDLTEILKLFWHYLWFVIICTILAGAAGFLLCKYTQQPYYKSTTGVYILNKSDNTAVTLSDTQLATQLTKDYEQLITSRYVLESVIAEFGLDLEYEQLLDKVSVSNVTDTRIVHITVTDQDPALAQKLADAICAVASEHIKNVMNSEAVNVVDRANYPKRPAGPSSVKWAEIGIMIGFLFSAAVIFLKYLVDDTIKTSEDVEHYLGVSTLALIPLFDEGTGKKKKKKKKKKTARNAAEYMNEYLEQPKPIYPLMGEDDRKDELKKPKPAVANTGTIQIVDLDEVDSQL
ncbi:MAG: protein-tyrosine kinase [Lachnospiraceae bacterium]|nr:protein-tyrosine kinase [Lachnospiraceae bacterium]